MSNNENWIQDEFSTINLTDPRLHKRFFKIALELADRPAEMETFVNSRAGMTQGWTGSFDKLEDLLKAL